MDTQWTDNLKFFSLFMEINKAYAAKCYGQMTRLGIHPGQIPFLMLLSERGEMSQKEVAGELHVKPPTVNVMVQRMEKAGLVSRRQDQKDQRVTRICLTEKGMRIKEKVVFHVKENDQYVLRGFSEAEECLLRRFLQQIVDNINSIPEHPEGESEEKGNLTSD